MSKETKKLKIDSEVKIGTHSGTFHCDEVLACFMLQQLDKYKNAEIVRSRDLNVLKTCDILVDVGDKFNPDENLFDHHQKSFTGTLSSLRPELGNGFDIKLSSAGLIYTYFGEHVISSILRSKKNLELPEETIKIIYKKVYEHFIREIDAIDNGIQICDGEPRYQITTHLSSRIGGLNPAWNDSNDVDETVQFEKAKQKVGEELIDKIIYFSTSWLPAREIVKKAIQNAYTVHESGEILQLNKFCPWKYHLFDLEKELNIEGKIKYVLFEDRSKDWRVISVPNAPNSFICRKFLHKDWRGLRSEEISSISGIEDAKFCHASGFIGGAFSREGVFNMAIKSLNGDYVD